MIDDRAGAPDPATTGGLVPTDPELVLAWASGWSVSRRTAAPTAVVGGHRIEVGLPGHQVRYVLPDADPQVLPGLAERVAGPGVWLKVCADQARVAPLLGDGWRFGAAEYLMATPLTAESAAAPTGYRLEVEAADGAVDVRIVTENGEPAATGRIGISGAVAVFDQVVTEPAHRRRGLGSVVMRELSAAAREHGAERGVLVATEDGLALYRTLGWQLHTTVTPAVYEPADRAAR